LGFRSKNPLPESFPYHQNHSSLETIAVFISPIFPILSLPPCSLRSLASKPTPVFLPTHQFRLPLQIKAPLEISSRMANNHMSKSAFLKRRSFSPASIKLESQNLIRIYSESHSQDANPTGNGGALSREEVGAMARTQQQQQQFRDHPPLCNRSRQMQG
jgi:hypothetical protein